MPLSPSPDSPTIRVSTAPPAPKLRDSCHSCAASKLKCSKEKPTCARCAKRGRVCEYLASRRAGRTPSTQSINTASLATSSSSSSLSSAELSWYSAVGMVACPSPGAITVSVPGKEYGTNGTPFLDVDIFPNLRSTESQPETPGRFVSRFDDLFDDLFAPPLSFDLLSSSSISPTVDRGLFGSQAIESFLDSGNAALDIDAHAWEARASLPDEGLSEKSSHMSSMSTLADAEVQTSPNTGTPSLFEPNLSCDATMDCSSGSCLLRALWVLKQLSPNASVRCSSSSTSHTEKIGVGIFTDSHGHTLTIQSVITQNKQIVEVVGRILQCMCSQDSYLLAVLALAIFKVLGWYEVAAHENDETKNEACRDNKYLSFPAMRRLSTPLEQVMKGPAIVGSYHIDGQDRGRMGAQLVLSELSRLQGLVKILSQRLGVLQEKGKIEGTRELDGNPTTGACREDRTFPLSSSLLEQLEVDLRKRLRSLSAEMVERLRHE
jgi:Aflatoxin regulatory protein/Fungal Zn(2)-Cys(6) binuclear cluster domain